MKTESDDKDPRLLDTSGKQLPRKVTWFERVVALAKYLKKIWVRLVAAVGVVAALVANFERISGFIFPDSSETTGASISEPEKQSTESSKLEVSRKYDKSAPVAKFADGANAFVGFSLITSVLANDAPSLASTHGTREAAMEILAPQAESILIGMLETLTEEEVRRRRAAIAEEVTTRMIPIFKESGITLEKVIIREIDSF